MQPRVQVDVKANVAAAGEVKKKIAAMWAYNGWLHEEFCAADPNRLLGMGQTAVRSVAEAIEDFRQFKEMGFRGVMMPGNPATDEDYDHPSFDPLWRAAVEL